MPIRILIVDDHRILRAGLKTLLSPDPNMEVVGEATNGEEALQITQELKPNVVLLDVGMPGMNALDVTEKIIEMLPETRVLILTMHEDSTLLQAFLRKGASGYIVKRAAESELVDAIYAVWRGMIYVHPSLMRALVTPVIKSNVSTPDDMEPLTSREMEVLKLAARGHTNRQIASMLNISVRTVETHRANLMEKLNLHNRIDLARYAEEHGLL